MKKLLHQFLFGTSLGANKTINIGWLLFRLHVGLSIAIHAGWPKMNTLAAPGWFNDQVAGLGFSFPSPAFWATVASWGEFVGGICIALGILTRFNALQLAFQFFVISFLWYDNPEPLTGMYFQNTLFMAFVLIAFAGGGKYSLDKLITDRVRLRVPAKIKLTAACLFFYMFGANAQNISMADVKPLAGNWKGTLTYLDYSSNKEVPVKAEAIIRITGEHVFKMTINYPDEPSQSGSDNYKIKKGGTMLNKQKLIERALLPDGSLKLVFESRGKDGNDHKPAIFHHEMIISKDRFILRKLVQFEGTASFIQRNQYSFER